jgi:ATP-dependent helicase/nuclease subunit B
MSAQDSRPEIKSWRRLKKPGQPGVFTIPSTNAFVDVLAVGLKADAGVEPLALARMTVLLPTRRACRALREAFLRLGGGTPVLLPRLIPLNDLDEDETLLSGFAVHGDVMADIPPPIDALRRQMLLAALILKRDDTTHDQAVALAAELARLIDQMQTERIDFAALKALVPDDYAAHWQDTLRFLDIITASWPNILRDEGCIDPIEHRNRLFAAQAHIWREMGERLPGPIIAAGSTGSIPATAELLAVIARLPNGCVVLPGLDQVLDQHGWSEIDETHPQFGLKHLLHHLKIDRDNVTLWPGSVAPAPNSSEHARLRFVSELMRPAAATDAWVGLSLPPTATDGLHLLTAPTPREEAAAIAMAMREALQTPGKTCALVTPDRDLALRVSGELERWGVAIDDSAGRDLDISPVGVFLRLVAQMVGSDFAPLPVLAACKHPLAAAGLDTVAFRDVTRKAERALFRGPRPASGLDALRQIASGLDEHRDEITIWVDRLACACDGFTAAMAMPEAPVASLLEAHMRCAEALAATHDTAGPLRLWAGDDGESAALVAAELATACEALPPLKPLAYPALFTSLLKGRVVRPRYGRHPRLAILGPLEARLQRFDTLILAGLNEGTWPADPAPDPWLSRPMRARCGLPSPERRIGLAAHDIAEAMCGPRVILSRATKVEGTPSVPSRWLMRLDQVMAAARLPSLPERALWLDAARMVTRPREIRPWPAPEPRPPLSARPRRLSVTQIETWMRDPYAIYARMILRLPALDPIDADVAAADYGTLIHRALQEFVATKATTEQHLLDIGAKLFSASTVRPAVRAFWWPRFGRIARWFVANEHDRRKLMKASHVEVKGTLTLPGPAGPFELVAKADRIDVKLDGSVILIDYKTGQPPKPKEVIAGFAPQLPLEAAMVLRKAFAGVAATNIAELAFWHLDGREDGAKEISVKAEIQSLTSEAYDGLTKLIAEFDKDDTPYRARPRPEFAPKYSDYEHLARIREWTTSDEGES